ncbi:MAG: ATP-dependent helicase [Candidatus Electrothrix sp. AR3]|nr:ATP-dependent helicase [Candidatus Electrothrix sp. AR3]
MKLNAQYYSQIEENEDNSKVIKQISEFVENHSDQTVYLINKPLGDSKYNYEYEDGALVLLSPKHKIFFLDLKGNKESFDEYCEDFIEDLGSISDKFEYKKEIGRPRKWKSEIVVRYPVESNFNLELLFKDNTIEKNSKLQRKCELLISLLVGSINDIDKTGIEEPLTLLEKIKRKIILFDGEQTRFIYKTLSQKKINIQGLSGTGKTELLLHKLKEIYVTSSEKKIFFTCHNKILASNIRKRIPDFFNFMKVEKQIKWDEQLWVVRAWGSNSDKNSGVYSYICHFYQIPFQRFDYRGVDFDKVCKDALLDINKLEPDSFKFAFDYILIDESQDFPQSFFDLCEKVTSTKIYIAGDIFQNIFETQIEEKIVNADFLLNRCYRTDPRTLMFAQALGMGLFEKPKLNWLTNKEWEGCGYIIEENNNKVFLSREPVRRFEDLEVEDVASVILENVSEELIDKVISIIQKIKKDNLTVQPDDIAIILVDSGKYIYNLADQIEYAIMDRFSWEVNKGYESKKKIENTLFVSNKNNIKGLEFPFVICITRKIQSDLRYRNTLYTMLTRSFIQSYLLVCVSEINDVLIQGLNKINLYSHIYTTRPNEYEEQKIRNTIIKLNQESSIPYKDFLNNIFNEKRINKKLRPKLEQIIELTCDRQFDQKKISKTTDNNKDLLK